MMRLAEFFNMGGYAFYVWSAYGIVFVVLVLNIVFSFVRFQKLRRGDQ